MRNFSCIFREFGEESRKEAESNKKKPSQGKLHCYSEIKLSKNKKKY